jgi:hypothetical protein
MKGRMAGAILFFYFAESEKRGRPVDLKGFPPFRCHTGLTPVDPFGLFELHAGLTPMDPYGTLWNHMDYFIHLLPNTN